VVSRAAQFASDRGIVVVASAGNEGAIASWRIITAPADAEGVVAVGNVNSNGNRSPSSSIGPSADGRIKPDLVALGSGVRVIAPDGSISSASGTSLSAPLVTSLVAGTMQRFPELTGKQVVELLKSTASQATNPNNQIGFGIPNYSAAVRQLSKPAQSAFIEVYPNPVHDTLVISPIDPDILPGCRIQLLSGTGQLMDDRNVTFDWLNNVYRADLSGYAEGVYFVRITTRDRKYHFKVVKH